VTKSRAPDDRVYRPRTISCAVCDVERVVMRPSARFCSDRCRKRAARGATRQCIRCRAFKPASAFYRLRDGLNPRCAECCRELARQRRAARGG